MENVPLSSGHASNSNTKRILSTRKVIHKKILWGSIALLALTISVYGFISLFNKPVIAPNTFIEQVDLSGLPIPEAKKKYIDYWKNQRSKKDLLLKSKYLNKKISCISAEECGLTLDYHVLNSLDFPLLGFWEKLKINFNTYHAEKTVFPAPLTYNSSDSQVLKNVIKNLVAHPKKAKVLYQKGHIIYQSEGIDYELDESSPEIEDSLIQAYITKRMTLLPIKMAKPKVSDASLHQIKDVVSEFSTKFKVQQQDRNYNLNLASKIWNGIIIMPGEKISFNETVGTRTAAKGFRLATVFVNGKLEKGIGGGICQVSTTLYNALVLANLKIITRSSHSRPVAYVPLGRDAAVVYGGTDLIFENNQSNPIAISSEVYGDTLKFRILGTKVQNQKIEITETILNEQKLGTIVQEDKSIPIGTSKILDTGAVKAKVQSYRTVYQDGQKISSKPLHFSYYRGAPRIVLKGTGPVVKPKVIVLNEIKISPETTENNGTL